MTGEEYCVTLLVLCYEYFFKCNFYFSVPLAGISYLALTQSEVNAMLQPSWLQS